MSHLFGCRRNSDLYAPCTCEDQQALNTQHAIEENTSALIAMDKDLRAWVSDLRAENAALKAELTDFKQVQIEIVPGIHGEGEETNATPAGIKATIDSLQNEWDQTERDLTACREELEIRTRQRDYWNEERNKLFQINGDMAHTYDSAGGVEALAIVRGLRERLATAQERNAALEKLLTESVSRIQEMDGESPLVKAIMKAL